MPEQQPDAMTALAEVLARDVHERWRVDGDFSYGWRWDNLEPATKKAAIEAQRPAVCALLASGLVVLTADAVTLPEVEEPSRDEDGNLRCGVDGLFGHRATADELRSAAGFYLRHAAQRFAAAAYLDAELRPPAGGESTAPTGGSWPDQLVEASLRAAEAKFGPVAGGES